MDKEDPTKIFLMVLTKRSVAVAGYNNLWVNGGSNGLDEYPKGILFIFIHKKENENLTIENPRVSVLTKLFFKALKVWVIQFFP